MKSHDEVMTVVRARLRRAGFSPAMEQRHCHWISRYYRFCLRLPWALPSGEKAAAFRSHLAGSGDLSARAQWQAGAALRFLYAEVLGRPLSPNDGPRAAP